MIDQNVTENRKQPDTQKISRYARAYGLAVTLIHEFLFVLFAGFTGLGIYQFMVMLGWLPAIERKKMTDPSNAPNADRAICAAFNVMTILLEEKNAHTLSSLETPMTPSERTLREQGVNHRAHSQCNGYQRQSVPGDYARYESLKAIYTASACTQEEYIAATERAKLEAEV